jgi:DNA invertase Pin-like site-specific DNA recombinase
MEPLMENTKAFGYLRVSGKAQVEGDGFERQRAEIEKYARAHGIVIAQWFEEKGVTGTADAEDRPAWQELMVALLSNGVKTVLIEKLDRLARDPFVQEHILLLLRKQGFTLISASEPDLCNDDPSREMMRFIFGAVSRYDKRMIVAKLKAARNRKKAQTGRCEGRKPFGHYDGEVATLAHIRDLHAQGLNYEQSSKALNTEGLKTRSGGKWYPATVRRILLSNAA